MALKMVVFFNSHELSHLVFKGVAFLVSLWIYMRSRLHRTSPPENHVYWYTKLEELL